jgi:hypothetical protein
MANLPPPPPPPPGGNVPPPLPYGIKELPPIPNMPPLPPPVHGQSIMITEQEAREIAQSFHYMGITEVKPQDLLANNKDFKPSLIQ